MKKKKILLMFSLLVGISIFFGVLWNTGFTKIGGVLSKISWGYLGLFLLVSVLILLARVLKWTIILRTKKVKVSFFKLLLCKISGIAVSFLTPSAFFGGGIAMSYLLKKDKVRTHVSISSVLLDKSFELISNSLLTLIGIIVLVTNFAIPDNTMWTLLTAPIILMGVIYYFYQRMKSKKGFFTSIIKFLGLNKIEALKNMDEPVEKCEKEMSKFFRKKKKESLFALGISAGAWLLMFLEFKFILLSMGHNVSWIIIFSAMAVVGFAYIIPVPAALGALEAGQASLFSLVGLGAGVGVVLSLLIRVRDIMWTFIGLSYLSLHGLIRKR